MIAFRRFKGSSPRLSVTLQIGECGAAGESFCSEVEGEAEPLLMGAERFVGVCFFRVCGATGCRGSTETRLESCQLEGVAPWPVRHFRELLLLEYVR